MEALKIVDRERNWYKDHCKIYRQHERDSVWGSFGNNIFESSGAGNNKSIDLPHFKKIQNLG